MKVYILAALLIIVAVRCGDLMARAIYRAGFIAGHAQYQAEVPPTRAEDQTMAQYDDDPIVTSPEQNLRNALEFLGVRAVYFQDSHTVLVERTDGTIEAVRPTPGVLTPVNRLATRSP